MPTQRIGDIELYYEVAGQGQPMVFVHGLGSSTRDWENQVSFFARYFQTITFDLRGHGKTDKPSGPYTMAQMTEDCIALLRALNTGPAHIVGLSLGGMLAFEIALRAPDLYKTMTIVNSGPEVPAGTRKQQLILLKNYIQRVLIVRLLGMRAMGKALSERLFIKPEQAELRRVFVERWAENDPHAYLAALRAIGGWSVLDQVHRILCPTLVLAADGDYTSVAFKESYVSRMPRAELVIIPDSRHMTPIERPVALNEALMLFLSRHQQQN